LQGLIDYSDYLTGHALCCRGTKRQVYHFLFQVVDLSGDGCVNGAELRVLLNHLPKGLIHAIYTHTVKGEAVVRKLEDAGEELNSPHWHLRTVEEIVRKAMQDFSASYQTPSPIPSPTSAFGLSRMPSLQEDAFFLTESEFARWMDADCPELLDFIQSHFFLEPHNAPNDDCSIPEFRLDGGDPQLPLPRERGWSNGSSVVFGEAADLSSLLPVPPLNAMAVLETVLPASGSSTGPKRTRFLSKVEPPTLPSIPSTHVIAPPLPSSTATQFDTSTTTSTNKGGIVGRVTSFFRKRAESVQLKSNGEQEGGEDKGGDVIRRSVTITLGKGVAAAAQAEIHRNSSEDITQGVGVAPPSRRIATVAPVNPPHYHISLPTTWTTPMRDVRPIPFPIVELDVDMSTPTALQLSLSCSQCRAVQPLVLPEAMQANGVDRSRYRAEDVAFTPAAGERDGSSGPVEGSWYCLFSSSGTPRGASTAGAGTLSATTPSFVASFRAGEFAHTSLGVAPVLSSLGSTSSLSPAAFSQQPTVTTDTELDTVGVVASRGLSQASLATDASEAPRDYEDDVEPADDQADTYNMQLQAQPSLPFANLCAHYATCAACGAPRTSADLRTAGLLRSVDGTVMPALPSLPAAIVPSSGPNALSVMTFAPYSPPINLVAVAPAQFDEADTGADNWAMAASVFSAMDSGSHDPHSHPLMHRRSSGSGHFQPGKRFRPGVRNPSTHSRVHSSPLEPRSSLRSSSSDDNHNQRHGGATDGPAAMSAAMADAENLPSSSMFGGAAARAVGFVSRFARSFRFKRKLGSQRDRTSRSPIADVVGAARTHSSLGSDVDVVGEGDLDVNAPSTSHPQVTEDFDIAAMHPNATVSGATWAHFQALIRNQIEAQNAKPSTPPILSSPFDPPIGPPLAAMPVVRALSDNNHSPRHPKLPPIPSLMLKAGPGCKAHAHTVSGALGREMAGALAEYSRPEALAAADLLDLQIDRPKNNAAINAAVLGTSAVPPPKPSLSRVGKLDLMSFAGASRSDIARVIESGSGDQPTNLSITMPPEVRPDLGLSYQGGHVSLHHSLLRENLLVSRTDSATHLQSTPTAEGVRHPPARGGRFTAAMTALYTSPLGTGAAAEEAQEEAALIEQEKRERQRERIGTQTSDTGTMDDAPAPAGHSEESQVPGAQPVSPMLKSIGSTFTGRAPNTTISPVSFVGHGTGRQRLSMTMFSPHNLDRVGLMALDERGYVEDDVVCTDAGVTVTVGKQRFLQPAVPYSFQLSSSALAKQLRKDKVAPTPNVRRTPGTARSALFPVLGLHAYNSENPPPMSLGAGAARALAMHGAPLIEHEGWLYKMDKKREGHHKKRWYYLQQNFLYWYSTHLEGEPRGVLFLEGSYVKLVSEPAQEAKEYYRFCIHTSSTHGDRVRVLYARSAAQRDEWLSILRRACRSVPFDEEYELGPEIGAGKFARVYKATKRASSEVFAVKVVNKSGLTKAELELLRTEVAILKLVQHPHIIRLENVFETSLELYIVMELLEGGELFNNLVGRSRFNEDEARNLIKPLVESIAYLHSLGIVHRDIKPENLLCSGKPREGSSFPFGDVKIADFGLSKLVHPGEVLTMPCGTLAYAAPEVISRQGYGREADLWSLGVILYLVVRGRLPFDSTIKEQVIALTIEAKVDFTHKVWQSWTPEGLNFVQSRSPRFLSSCMCCSMLHHCCMWYAGLLCPDPASRLSARRAMQHPWLRKASGKEMSAISS
jgi:serine/threonine protein kinase